MFWENNNSMRIFRLYFHRKWSISIEIRSVDDNFYTKVRKEMCRRQQNDEQQEFVVIKPIALLLFTCSFALCYCFRQL